MKKIVLLLVFLVSMVMSEQMTTDDMYNWIIQVQGDSTEITTTDSMYTFLFYTKWRSNFSIREMDQGTVYPDYSSMDWTFNIDKKIGYVLDITENVTSFYKIEDLNWYESDGKNSMVISMKLTSNVGNTYHAIINHANKSLILVGEMDHVVIRRYYFK